MATATLVPLSYASSPTFETLPLSANLSGFVPTGDADAGVCIREASDGKTLNSAIVGAGQIGILPFYFEDDGTIPLDAVITGVQLTLRHTADPDIDNTTTQLLFIKDPFTTYDFGSGGEMMDFTVAVPTSLVHATNPITAAAWARADLFHDNDASGNGHGAFFFIENATDSVNEVLDQIFLTVTYAGGSNPQIRRYDGHTDRVFARLPLI